jgi:hypothetical protein
LFATSQRAYSNGVFVHAYYAEHRHNFRCPEHKNYRAEYQCNVSFSYAKAIPTSVILFYWKRSSMGLNIVLHGSVSYFLHRSQARETRSLLPCLADAANGMVSSKFVMPYCLSARPKSDKASIESAFFRVREIQVGYALDVGKCVGIRCGSGRPAEEVCG